MKGISVVTKTEVIPATEAFENEIKTFRCDFCDYETEDEDNAKEHYGVKHSFKKTATVPGVGTFLFFECEEDFDANIEYDETGDSRNGKFTGAGWYFPYGDSVPCGRGCCSNYVVTLIPALDYIKTLQQEASKYTDLAARCQAVVDGVAAK